MREYSFVDILCELSIASWLGLHRGRTLPYIDVAEGDKGLARRKSWYVFVTAVHLFPNADLIFKRDFDTLNANLTRVADAIERLEATLRENDSAQSKPAPTVDEPK